MNLGTKYLQYYNGAQEPTDAYVYVSKTSNGVVFKDDAEPYSVKVKLVGGVERQSSASTVNRDVLLQLGCDISWSAKGNNVLELHFGDMLEELDIYECFKENVTVTSVTFSAHCKLQILYQGQLSRLYMLEKLTLPPSLVDYRKWCADKCTSLTSLTFTTTVDDLPIEQSSFTGLTSLREVTFYCSAPQAQTTFLDGAENLESIYVPSDSIASWQYYFPNFQSILKPIPTYLKGGTKHFQKMTDARGLNEIPTTSNPIIGWSSNNDEISMRV